MIDNGDLRRVQRRLGSLKHKAPQVISNALNRAANNLRTTVSKETRKEYNIKAKTIRNTITIKRSTRTSLGAAVISEGNVEPITSYKVKLVSSDEGSDKIQVSVKKDNVSDLINAFAIERYDNHIHERVGASRFPIRQIFGPAVPQILANPETRKIAESEAWKTYRKRLDHEITRLLEARR